MKLFTFLFFVLLSGCAAVDPSVEVGQTLHHMNQAYKNKDLDGFMHFISPVYQGNRDDLRIAVENDFAGFTEVDYETSVFQTSVNEQTGIYRSAVYYFRTAKSPRYGIDNQSGETVLTFSKDEDGLKLIKMPDPVLYGLIIP